MKIINTHIDVLQSITDLAKLMSAANRSGATRVSFYISDIAVNEFLKVWDSLSAMHKDVRFFSIDENFNDDHLEISIRIAEGFYIYIQSEKMKTLKPKINLINYN